MEYNFSNILFFIFFIIPGFVSIKTYDLLIPSEKRDFSKSSIELLSYSCINAAIFLYPVIAFKSHFLQFSVFSWVISILVLFIVPILWPILFLILINCTKLQDYIINPCPKPWDWVFGRRKEYWVLIHLKDGRKVGGKYMKGSYASSFPNPEQLYLSEGWKIDENGDFLEKIEQTEGILIDKEQWEILEFFTA